MKKLFIILSLLITVSASAQPTQINGNQIKDQAITNAKIKNDAGIHHSKINFTGIVPATLGLEGPLTFNAPLSKTSLSVSLSTITVPFGGTGLTTVGEGLVPFGNSATSLDTSTAFSYIKTTETLSLTNLKVSGGTPAIGHVLTSSDIEGNLVFTNPASVIPTNTIITDNQVVVGTGTSIEGAGTGLTYDQTTETLTVATVSGDVTGSASSFTGSLSGDVTGGQTTTVVGKINGISLASLATGILKNTTETGVPSIAVAGTDYQAPLTNPVTGTGTAGQVALFSNTSEITGDSGLTYEASTDTLSVTGAVSINRAINGSLSKTLIDGTSTDFSTIAIADGAMIAGELLYKVTATITGQKQVISGRIRYAVVREDTTYVVDYDEIGQSNAVTTGVIAGTITVSATGGKITFSANFDSDQSAPNVTLYYRFNSVDNLAVTSL